MDQQEDRGGGRGRGARQKPMQGQGQGGGGSESGGQSQQQPQKCPRCDSFNTKFCYYNNYSLSQPRYFCKTCRRYWTQGGTLRNVPVGGGVRKGKRAKANSSTNNSTGPSHQPPQPPVPQQATQEQAPLLVSLPLPGISSNTSYYSNSGYLSSLPTIHPFSTQSQPFSRLSPELGSSNSGLLPSLNLVPSFGSAHQSQFYHQMGTNRDHNLYNQTTTGTSADWSQLGFANNNNNMITTTTSDAALWSSLVGSSTTTSVSPTTANVNSTTRTSGAGGASAASNLIPNHQWSDQHLSGFGHPPTS